MLSEFKERAKNINYLSPLNNKPYDDLIADIRDYYSQAVNDKTFDELNKANLEIEQIIAEKLFNDLIEKFKELRVFEDQFEFIEKNMKFFIEYFIRPITACISSTELSITVLPVLLNLHKQQEKERMSDKL
jgi:hypothetical protein